MEKMKERFIKAISARNLNQKKWALENNFAAHKLNAVLNGFSKGLLVGSESYKIRLAIEKEVLEFERN